MNDKDEILLAELVKEAERIKEDAEHSAKGHFEAARLWKIGNMCLGVPATILATLAGISALNEHYVWSAVIALLVAILSGLLTFLKPAEQASRYLKSGNEYNAVRNDARIFMNIKCRSTTSTADLEKELADLNSRRNTLNVESPQIPRWAYNMGKTNIDAGEANYRVDK